MKVSGRTSGNAEKKDESWFVHKPHLRTNCIESNFEEDNFKKSQIETKILPSLVSHQEAASQSYDDDNFNDTGKKRSTGHVTFKNKTLDNVWFVKVTFYQQHLTTKYCVDEANSNSVEEWSMLRLDPTEKLKWDEQGSIKIEGGAEQTGVENSPCIKIGYSSWLVPRAERVSPAMF